MLKTQLKEVTRVADAFETLEGGGVLINRAMPNRELDPSETDPFLLLDYADLEPQEGGPAFPRHSHRGFEFIFYLLKGSAGHHGSVGHDTVVREGGLQKCNTGSGIWHEEGGPKGEAPARTVGIQLWVNLAQKDKKSEPDYQALQSADIPVKQIPGGRVKVLAGPDSKLKMHTPITYLDVTLEKDAAFNWTLDKELEGAFLFVLDGEVKVGNEKTKGTEKQVLVLGPGQEVSLHAGAKGAHFLLLAGKPHREPVRWRGPYVD
jgi:redox-sensitive bicupin YhaK (pirin superfamily)